MKKYTFNNGILFNGDTIEAMDRVISEGEQVDLILTSPPYNTRRDTKYYYDIHKDLIDNDEYTDFTLKVFNRYDEILRNNGVVLYNMGYGSNNSTQIFETIYHILRDTNFIVADVIGWKKRNAFPNNMSPNKLTRIWEFVFVLCRKSEYNTFKTNKIITSTRPTGQHNYNNILNFIEAKNNDGSNPLNKATFSTDLVDQLFDIYLQPNSTVLDNFSGTGTTLVSVSKVEGCRFIGVELSTAQTEFTVERLKEYGSKLLSKELENE